MYRLDLRRLEVSAGGTRILHPIELSFLGGELVALLGPSGSGKSTLLTATIGFRRGEGRVELCGVDLYRRFEELKTRIGFVPQDDVVHTALSVEESLAYAAELRLPSASPEERRAMIARVLDQVGLADRRAVRIGRLSGGQRKRVSIGIELLASPPLLFLDEPTSGLDPALEEKAMVLFRELTDAGRITVVTTHVLASLDLVDVVVMLAKGHLVYVGPAREAISFFGVADFPSIYRTLASTRPEEWRAKLEKTALYRTYVLERLAAPAPPLPPAGPLGAARRPPAAPPAASPPSAPAVEPKPRASAEEVLARLKAEKKPR